MPIEDLETLIRFYSKESGPQSRRRDRSTFDREFGMTKLESLIGLSKLAGLSSRLNLSASDLLEITMDLLWQLSIILEDGSMGPQNNVELEFSDKYLDPLANPLQIRKRRPRQIFQSTEMSDFCQEVATVLSLYRQFANVEIVKQHLAGNITTILHCDEKQKTKEDLFSYVINDLFLKLTDFQRIEAHNEQLKAQIKGQGQYIQDLRRTLEIESENSQLWFQQYNKELKAKRRFRALWYKSKRHN